MPSEKSDSSGEFAFSALPPGSYALTVEMTGFRAGERRNVEVSGARIADLGPVTLHVGPVAKTIDVVGASPMHDLSSVTAEGTLDPPTALGYLGAEGEERASSVGPEVRRPVQGGVPEGVCRRGPVAGRH